MSAERHPDYKKYADDQVRTRELEDAIGRLRLGLFLAALGPVILFLAHFLGFDLPKIVRLGLLATAPLGILVTIIRFAQVPSEHKFTKSPLTVLVLTFVAAIATFVLAKKFSLLP